MNGESKQSGGRPKLADIPRIKVQAERKQRWMAAYWKELQKQPDLSFADFVRRAMDAYSDAIERRKS